MKPHFCSAFLSVLLILIPMAARAQNAWPQWRGPTRDSVVKAPAWPDTLDEATLGLLWRVELAEGYPGPIVAGDRVFTVETLNEQDEVARAFARATGEPLWQRSWPGAMKVPAFARRNGSWIKATPATDGEHLYVMGMVDELVCLNVAGGEIAWRVDFKERYGTRPPTFGQSSSPLIDGDAVYVQTGLSVCKLNKDTGETIWRTLDDERENIGGAFSSPVIAELAGKRQLVVQTRMELAGVDLESGAVLWRVPVVAFQGMNILTPTVVDENHVFTSAYGGGSVMLRVTADDDGTFTAEEAWKNDVEGYMSSPILYDGHLYLHGRDKKLRCMNAATGEIDWASDREFGEYWSSVINGGRILALDDRGILLLIQASPEGLKILDERRVTEAETWAHLAVVGEEVFIRELNALAVYRWQQPPGVD